MAGQAIRFIMKNGRAIPIRAVTGVTRATGATVLHKVSDNLKSKKKIKPNFMLKYGSEALSVAEGSASALLPSTPKGFSANAALHFGGEAAIGGLGALAYAGKGNVKARGKAIAKQEFKNQALGWGAYIGVSLGTKSGRKNVADAGKFVASKSKNILKMARRTLGIIESVE